ncbi:G-box-binding factor 4-like protein [Drosera capensis]
MGGGVDVGSGEWRRGGRKRAVAMVDKATEQKQRRMIKNRESAARSRERKQAHTEQLEELVTQLEHENACLLREEIERNRERLKQLMETVIPVLEKRRPPRALRRVHSIG